MRWFGLGGAQAASQPAGQAKIGLAAKTSLVALGILAALLLVEFYLRSPLVPVRYQWELLEAWAPERWWLEDVDPELWHRLPPGLDVVIREPGGIAFRVRTHSLGFTGIGFREESAIRPAWAVAVGDSFTMGWGVDLEQTWVKQLEKRCDKPVLNLGIAGTSPSVYTRVLERYGFSFRPQVVFYQIYVGNDLEDEWSFLQWRQHPWLAKMHLFAKRHSYLYVFLQPRLRRFLFSGDEQAGTAASNQDKEDRILKQGWALAKPTILAAQSHARAEGARFVMLLVPAPEEVRGPTVGAAHPAEAAREARKRARFLELCAAERIDCIDLQSALQQAAAGKVMYLGDRHFTVEANELVAEVIYRWVKERNLLGESN